MTKFSIYFIILICLGFFNACKEKDSLLRFKIENHLNMDRNFETVEIPLKDFNLNQLEQIAIKQLSNDSILTSQLLDSDEDGKMDLLLFQPALKANAQELFELIQRSKGEVDTTEEKICYSRFVPERTDDYAWENNRVAFRTYGPDAQHRFENNLSEGTLSSGIDAWLKRVQYSIIDKWYKKYTEKTGTYHEDTGEGLDNFHVGHSRGVGGIAYKNDSMFYLSKNFEEYKTLTNGPIRTSFILDYGSWDANGRIIKESKKISLDYGSNLSKIELFIEGVDTISAGLTLHEKDGVVTSNNEAPWMNYWQPHADSELGTAIVSSPKYYIDQEKFETDSVDLSNAYMHLKVLDGKAIYYAGFTWQKSGQFKGQDDWEQYLNEFSEKLSSPLEYKKAN